QNLFCRRENQPRRSGLRLRLQTVDTARRGIHQRLQRRGGSVSPPKEVREGGRLRQLRQAQMESRPESRSEAEKLRGICGKQDPRNALSPLLQAPVILRPHPQ